MGFLRFVRVQWDRATGAACVLAGAATLVAGWAQVSRSVYASQQVPYLLSCGLGGLFLLGVGATLWLSADLRDEWRHLDGLETRLAARVDELVREQLAVGPAATNESDRHLRVRSGP